MDKLKLRTCETSPFNADHLGPGQKVLGEGGLLEQKGGELSVFEPLVWGGSATLGGGSCCFFFFVTGIAKWHTFDTIDKRGNSFQFQRTKTFRAVVERLHLAGV